MIDVGATAVAISVEELLNSTRDAMLDAGADLDAAIVVATHLVEADLNGHSPHGLYRLPSILRLLEKVGAGGRPFSNKLDDGVLEVKGNACLGIVALAFAADTIVEYLSKHPLVVVGVSDYHGTTGAMGYYARIIAEAGNLAVCVCNSEASVPPTGGRQPILGTNPIAFSMPSKGVPIVVDIATSAWSYGRLVAAMRAGKKIPFGIVLDSAGNPSTDPNDADTGAMLPMAGHKGYGLGLMVELLSGPLIGAKAGAKAVPGGDGAFLFALSASAFREQARVVSDVWSLVSEILNSAMAPNSTDIRIPGNLYVRLAATDHQKAIDVSSHTIKELAELSPKHFHL